MEYIPVTMLDQNLYDAMHTSAAGGYTTLGGKKMSAWKRWEASLDNPNKYPGAKILGSVATTGAVSTIVTTLSGFGLVAGPAGLAGMILSGMGTSPRLVTLIVLNGTDERLDVVGSPHLNHGDWAAQPGIAITDDNLKPTGGYKPVSYVPAKHKAMDGTVEYGMSMWTFTKSSVDIGGLSLPFALYGVLGGVKFKTPSGSIPHFVTVFEVPENGKNKIYIASGETDARNFPNGGLASYVSDHSSHSTTSSFGKYKMQASMVGRTYPDGYQHDFDVVMTVSVFPK